MRNDGDGKVNSILGSLRSCAASPWTWAFLVQVVLVFALRVPFEFDVEGQHVHAVADDVYISACFGRSLAQGAGPVWFPGADAVEGFSSPVLVLYFAAVHTLPFFREEDLGLYALGLGLLALAGAFATGASIARRCARRASASEDDASQAGASVWCELAFVVTAPVAITWWIAEGFEITLLLVTALIALRISIGDQPMRRRALALGAVAAFALWVRMDGPLYVLPAFLTLLLDGSLRPRQRVSALTVAGSVLALALTVLLAVRHAIYGDLLPNTYYLKLGGSSLLDRILTGIDVNSSLLPASVAALGFGIWSIWRRPFGTSSAAIGSLALLLPGSVAYSIHNGG